MAWRGSCDRRAGPVTDVDLTISASQPRPPGDAESTLRATTDEDDAVSGPKDAGHGGARRVATGPSPPT